MKQEQRNRRRFIALGVAIALHLLLVGVLLLVTLRGHLPKPEATELVLVNLGNVEQASGEEEPAGLSAEPEARAPEVAQSTPTPTATKRQVDEAPKEPKTTAKAQSKPTPQPIQTQTHEESMRIAESKRKAEEEARRKAQEQAQRAKEQEERRLAEEERRRAEAVAAEAQRKAEQTRAAGARVSNAFGAGMSSSKGQGNSSGSGNQGSVGGSSGSFSLSGRSIVSNGGRLTPPRTSKAIRGRINVRITVDASGRVIDAQVDPRGTNIAEASIRSSAVAAARSTRFNEQEGAQEQRGIITYDFDIE